MWHRKEKKRLELTDRELLEQLYERLVRIEAKLHVLGDHVGVELKDPRYKFQGRNE